MAKKDKSIEALDAMLLNVLKAKRKRRTAKKKYLVETGLWDDFEMDNDILDAEDDY